MPPPPPPPPSRRLLPWLALTALYTALTLVYFWPLPRLAGDHIGPGFGDRIYARNRVTKSAISVNQTVDPALERVLCLNAASRRDGGWCAIPLRRVAQFEAFEKCAPGGIDPVRVFLPKTIILIDQVEIESGRKGRSHGLISLQSFARAAS